MEDDKGKILYSVIRFDSLVDLIGAVNLSLSRGWELQGGVSVTMTSAGDGFNSAGFLYAQAMVKRDVK